MEKRDIIDYKYEIIKQINKYRNSHGVRSLRSDYDQDKLSQNLADEISKNGTQHNGDETVQIRKLYPPRKFGTNFI